MKLLLRNKSADHDTETVVDARAYFDQDAALFTGFYDQDGHMLCEGDVIEIAPNVKSPLPPVPPVGTRGVIEWDRRRAQWVFHYKTPESDASFGMAKELATALPGEIIEQFEDGYKLTVKIVR